MSTATDTIQEFVSSEYKYGFTSNIDTETIPPGLNEDVIRLRRTSPSGCSTGASRPIATG
jgi:hypothetical protein